MKYRDLVRALAADGWKAVRQKGSHRVYHHLTKPGVVIIAGKPGKDVPLGTLACISHHLTDEARNRHAITSLRLLAVLNVLSEYASARQAARASY